MFKKVDVPVLGIVENMSYFICSKCNERHEIFSNGGVKKEAEKFKTPFLGELPLDKNLRIFSDEVKSYPICCKGDNDLYKFFKISSLNLDKLDSESQILDKIMLPNEKYKKYKNMFIKHPKSKNVQYSKLIKRIINFK